MHKYFAKLNEIHLAVDVVTNRGDRRFRSSLPNELRGACAERITYQIAQLAMTFMDYEDREAGASESDASSEPNGSIANQPVSRDLWIVNFAGGGGRSQRCSYPD